MNETVVTPHNPTPQFATSDVIGRTVELLWAGHLVRSPCTLLDQPGSDKLLMVCAVQGACSWVMCAKAGLIFPLASGASATAWFDWTETGQCSVAVVMKVLLVGLIQVCLCPSLGLFELRQQHSAAVVTESLAWLNWNWTVQCSCGDRKSGLIELKLDSAVQLQWPKVHQCTLSLSVTHNWHVRLKATLTWWF